MIKQFRKRYWLVFVVIVFIGMPSCDHPTFPKNRKIERTGETTGGRTFYVIRETISKGKDVIKVLIEGEEEVVLEEIEEQYGTFTPKTQLDSINVYELPGTPNVIHIDWRSQSMIFYSPLLYHYLVFPEGDASMILLKGDRTSNWVSHYAFQWTVGEYHLDYTDQTLSIIEQWVDGGDRDSDSSRICYAKETQLSRVYQVDSEGTTLMTCEERYRTTEVPYDWAGPCNINVVEDSLEMTAWETTIMSPDDVIEKCSAIEPGS